MEDSSLWGRGWSSPLPSSSGCPRLPLSFWWGEGTLRSQLALPWYLFNPLLCEQTRLQVRAFHGRVLFSLSLSLVIPQFGLLSHVSSLRLSSGHSGPLLTLSTNCAAHASLSGPCLLVVDASVWAASPLAVAVRHLFCGFFFFFFPAGYVAL